MNFKVCANCKRKLLVENFSIDREKKDGLDSNCKECKSELEHRYFMICSKCGNVRRGSISDFKKYKTGLCKKCHSKYFAVGKENPSWKDKDVGNSGLHKFIRRHNPPPKCCPLCGKKTKKLDLANINGNYNRDFENYMYLCHKCHSGMDFSKDWKPFRDVIKE